MRNLLLMLVCSSSVLAAGQTQSGNVNALKVIVVDGDEAANIVEEKIAAEPVIEVRDQEDRRVVGAVVRFQIRRTAIGNRVPALFAGGRAEVRTLTDGAGRAATSPLTPLEAGRFEIEIQVSHQGRSATATIRHTNFSTAAQARAVGREPGQSSGTAAANGGVAATTGATSPGSVGAAGASGAAAAAGGGGFGFGKLALVGLAVGGAGAGTAVALSRRSGGEAARVTAVTVSTRTGVQAATAFTFAVEAADFDGGSLTYAWEFGDGATTTSATPTHVYQSAGTYTVAVTVSDGRQSARSETSVIVFSLTGTWVGASTSLSGVYTLETSQSGGSITGRSSLPYTAPGQPDVAIGQVSNCTLSGTVRNGSPQVVLTQPPCFIPERNTLLTPIEYRLDLSSDGQTLSGVLTSSVAGAPTRQLTFRRTS